MKIIVFQLINGIYLGDEFFGDNTSLLTEFFSSDVGRISAPRFIDFLKDTTRKETSSNYCCLRKEKESVFIGCQFDSDPYKRCIKMLQSELILVLNQWNKLVNKRPQEIIMYKEGESYRLEGHGFPDKPQV